MISDSLDGRTRPASHVAVRGTTADDRLITSEAEALKSVKYFN